MRKLDFFRLQAPAAVPAHIGASSLKKSNFLIFSKVLRKGADQAICRVLSRVPILEYRVTKLCLMSWSIVTYAEVYSANSFGHSFSASNIVLQHTFSLTGLVLYVV